MGRVWQFFNQDADAAMDRIVKPYANFVVSHSLLMHVVYAGAVAAVWILVSRTVALLIIAVWVALLLYGVAAALWRRRS